MMDQLPRITLPGDRPVNGTLPRLGAFSGIRNFRETGESLVVRSTPVRTGGQYRRSLA
jgi:hypothetical protein